MTTKKNDAAYKDSNDNVNDNCLDNDDHDSDVPTAL